MSRSHPSYVINIATDVGNGKINTGVNFYSKPISTRQVIVAAEELYTAELQEYNIKKFGADLAYENGSANARFTCVLALILSNPAILASSVGATRESSVATSIATSLASTSTTINTKEKWQEFTDPSQLYQGCQLYVFDTNSPTPERGIIPRAALVVDADRIPSVAVSTLRSLPSSLSLQRADREHSTASLAHHHSRGVGLNDQRQHPQQQQQMPEMTRVNLTTSHHLANSHNTGDRYVDARKQQYPAGINSSGYVAGPAPLYPASLPSRGGGLAAHDASPLPRPASNLTRGDGSHDSTATNPQSTANIDAGYYNSNANDNSSNITSSGRGHPTQDRTAPPSPTPQDQRQQLQNEGEKAHRARISDEEEFRKQQQQQLTGQFVDRPSTRMFLFRQLLTRCVASGQSNSPMNDSIPTQALHGVLVQNEMFFPTDVFADITENRIFLNISDWERLSQNFAPVLDVLYDRIAAKTQSKARHGEEANKKRDADRMRDRIDELAEEEARLMARQAAIREEMARMRRDLQRQEQQERVDKDEKAKEWDVLTKFVTLKLRQHRLKREEEQINHQLSLL